MASLDSFDPVVQINTQKFTDSERDLILEVVARDESIRRQERSRIDHLKEELKELREKGVPEGQDEAYGRVCKRCRTPLGVVFNSGALCPNCEKKVCKNCRVNITHKEDAKNLPQWFCTYCAKIRDIKAESGAWFYDSKVQIDKKRKIYGSLLLKRLFTSRVKKSDNLIFKDPNWEDIIEERDEDLEDIDADDNGYVLVTPNSSGDFTVKEGNISQLLSSKAVVGLEGAHLMRKSQYDLLLQEEKSENESHSNNTNDAGENKPAKTLAQLAQHEKEEENYVTTNNHDEEYYDDKESTTTNINTLPTDTSLYNDAYSTEQYIEKRGSSSSSSDEEDDDKVSVGDDGKATEKENDINIQQNGSNENEAEDFNLVAGSEDNRDDIEEDIASSESEEVVAERKHSSEEELERLNNDLIQHQEERNYVFDIQENVFEGERPKFQERKSSSESEDEMEKLFDFKSMEKQGSVKSHQYVQQNDLDLRDLQKTFVLKKNVRVTKMKTDEHDETSSESSSSSDDEIDDDFEIPQVVLDRRNSSEEEFENLNMDLSKKLLQKQNIMEVEETVLEKPAKMENHEDVRKISSSSSDSELEIDFKAMQKIADVNLQAGDADKVSDDDEDVQFLSMAAYSKTKIKKFRTDEHSDQEISSSSDEEIASTFSNLKKKKKLHAEEEDLDSYFTEYKQTKDVSGSVDSLGSNYSNEGDFNELSSVAGEVFVGFRYDHNASRFEVQVHRAKDLPAADPKKNTTDPYAKVYLDPEPSKKGGKRKTKVKKHALNPEFDEVLEFNNIDYEEVITRSCLVSIWHHGMKHIKLGEVRINLEEFIQSGFSLLDPAPQWYTLSQATVRKEQVKFVGDLFIKLHYKTPSTQLASTKKQQTKLPNPTKGELNIHVVSAKSLGREGDTNPFCKVEIFSKDIIGAPKMKTSSISNSKDPWWSEIFVVPNVSWSHLENSVIQFSIWHFEKGKAHQLVGGVRIGLGKIQNGVEHDSFGEEVKTWKNFLDHPNEILEYTLPIRSTLESVKNEVIPPTESVKIISDDDHYKIKASKKESSASQTSFAKRFLNADTISLASSGSMLSIYSDAGGQRSDLVITGEILFSMKHDQDSGIFSVTVEKAKGIAAVNAKAQTSDPYVKVYLLPDKNKDSKKKTLHRRKTVNPEWHETVKYKINREELLKRTLQLAIWNHDRFGRNDFLGEVQINMKHYARSNELSKADPVWYTLQEAAPISIGDSTDKKGELTLCLKYVNDTLTVLIKEASNLTAADENKLSNPFVKCYLLPDKSRKSKRKTSIQKKTVNPVWNDKFEYSNVFENDLQSRVLEITVWDHDSSGHQFLGGLRCGSSHGDEYWHDCYDNEVTIWEAMIKHTGIFAEYSIPLRPTMVSKKGQINQVIPMITEELEKQRVNTPQPQEQQVVLPPGTPQIRVGLQYIDHVTSDYDDGNKKKKNSSQLMLHIKEARNLPSRPNGETPSTLAKFYLLPKRKQKIRTDVYLKSIEPQWDAEFAVTKDVTAEELREKALEIMICDMDDEAKGKERELAYVRLGSGLGVDSWDDSTDGEIEIWKSMLTQHNRWITKVLPLRICDSSTGDSFKKKKDKSRKSRKSIGEDSEPLEDDYIPNEGENDGSESPRTSALRAMGAHASTVIEMMQSRDPEPIHMRPQEGLSPIEEDEGEETFTPPQTLQSIPSITVSQDVQPGEPPFPGAGYNADKPKTKKEPPVMSLLKRTPSMGSLTSVYSTDSANIYDQVPIRGDIQFGMRYGHKKNLFEVHVFQARDIAAVDSKKGISDPYCKVYLLPDKTKSGKKKTKTRKKTLNPEWEEILEFSISIRDLRTRTLWLAVWHQERLGRNIFLGEVMLNMDILVDEGSQLEVPTPKWYTLCEKGSPPMVDLYKGFLKISVMFEDEDLMRRGGKAVMDYDDDSSKKKKKKKKKKEKQEGKGKIHLHLKEANDLPAADKDGLSDPFCKCYLLPLKPAKSKRKTPVIRHTRDPVWDFQTEYNVDYEDLPDLGLELTIWDWDRGVKNDFLGCARLNLGSRSGTWDDAEGEELLAWQHLIDEPNKWKDFTIPLRSKLDFRSVKR